MDRKQVKRLLALLRAKAEFPDRKLGIRLPRGFRKSFEDQPHFRGWINYHVTWDIHADDHWTVVPRKISQVAEWHRELIKVVPIIKPDGTIAEPDGE